MVYVITYVALFSYISVLHMCTVTQDEFAGMEHLYYESVEMIRQLMLDNMRRAEEAKGTTTTTVDTTTLDTYPYPNECARSFDMCGFQIFDVVTGRLKEPFMVFCLCPEGEECLQSPDDVHTPKYSYHKYSCYKKPASHTKTATEPSLYLTDDVMTTPTLQDRFGVLPHYDEL